ncbi:hypothetical protein [Acetobacter ghanensis]|uniref:Putative tail fiber assembly protein n=1 Tax=Acetobacter ghanensis TaxID=431306 RepID=A0A0U5F6N8_9PROT|nr:hypothetical protein [Acetobacter ghanensis]NHO40258.1 hypothetical protein [Acetobacter ghanensis]GBQ50681.1 hypothetical protein AA18895_1991 [Acetobacter ghanensis DSM 18895]CEF56153.1 putative tail fiber assembly protein [Acetobacter ghanensis]
MIYYGKNTNGSYGFFDDALGSVPSGAVEVTDSDYRALLGAQNCGAAIVASSSGQPQAVSEGGAGSVIDLSTVTAASSFTAPVSLKTQATSAQAWIQQQANLAGAMGEVFTADMKAYVLAINAIANGTDTTSTALPAQPTDVMTTTSAT